MYGKLGGEKCWKVWVMDVFYVRVIDIFDIITVTFSPMIENLSKSFDYSRFTFISLSIFSLTPLSQIS